MAKILLVDDHPDSREIVSQLLTMHGHEVESCCDAETAIVILRQRAPNAVVADQRLPGMSGLELIRHIRADPALQQIQVVLCSADDSRREAALAAGAMDFWLKGSDRFFTDVERLEEKLRDLQGGT